MLRAVGSGRAEAAAVRAGHLAVSEFSISQPARQGWSHSTHRLPHYGRVGFGCNALQVHGLDAMLREGGSRDGEEGWSGRGMQLRGRIQADSDSQYAGCGFVGLVSEPAFAGHRGPSAPGARPVLWVPTEWAVSAVTNWSPLFPAVWQDGGKLWQSAMRTGE